MEKNNTWVADLEEIIKGLPDVFTLTQVYDQKQTLVIRHPGNRHPKAKIRQTLQALRDQGKIIFLEPGKYKRVS